MQGICTSYASPVGELLLAALPNGLCGLYYGCEDGRKDLHRRFPEVRWSDGALPGHAAALEEYFARRLRRFELPMEQRGTPFALRVWQALRGIPYGQTRTYGDLASELGTSARAVGLACGRNPVSIIVPCHRVVGRDGSLVGYGGGIEAKRFLLELERS